MWENVRKGFLLRPGLTTNLTRASTGSPCSKSGPPSPPRWGWLCQGRSGTWCDTSALTDKPMLKHSAREHTRRGVRTVWPRQATFTFWVGGLHFHHHFLLAAHPRQPLLLGCGSLVHVLRETLHVLWTPCEISPPTDNGAPRRLGLSREKTNYTVSYSPLLTCKKLTGSLTAAAAAAATTVGQTGSLLPRLP